MAELGLERGSSDCQLFLQHSVPPVLRYSYTSGVRTWGREYFVESSVGVWCPVSFQYLIQLLLSPSSLSLLTYKVCSPFDDHSRNSLGLEVMEKWKLGLGQWGGQK